jgi:hypothetical protein
VESVTIPDDARTDCPSHRLLPGCEPVSKPKETKRFGFYDRLTVGETLLGLNVLIRLFSPRDAFADIDPERVLVGHGPGVFEDADAALTDAIGNARHRFPRALLATVPREIRAMVDAARQYCHVF